MIPPSAGDGPCRDPGRPASSRFNHQRQGPRLECRSTRKRTSESPTGSPRSEASGQHALGESLEIVDLRTFRRRSKEAPVGGRAMGHCLFARMGVAAAGHAGSSSVKEARGRDVVPSTHCAVLLRPSAGNLDDRRRGAAARQCPVAEDEQPAPWLEPVLHDVGRAGGHETDQVPCGSDASQFAVASALDRIPCCAALSA